MTYSVAAVAIGRNEGKRLERCLTSLIGQVEKVIYVDSGSTDGSISLARSIGAAVVTLNTSVPFTAARARNAGFAALEQVVLAKYVQFVDGDCAVDQNWIKKACEVLDTQSDIGIVTGWRTEIDPVRNVYHEMIEFEWHRPVGDIRSCGGDMLVRSDAFAKLGGFNSRLIASEDEEFCLRMKDLGLRVHRLPAVMTYHDADMNRFSQWWRRTVRSGHGFAEVGRMQPGHFVAERRRMWLYGGICPAILLTGLATGTWYLAVFALAAYIFNWSRTVQGLVHAGLPLAQAAHHSVYLTMSKIANMQGLLTYYLRRWRGLDMQIIEYK